MGGAVAAIESGWMQRPNRRVRLPRAAGDRTRRERGSSGVNAFARRRRAADPDPAHRRLDRTRADRPLARLPRNAATAARGRGRLADGAARRPKARANLMPLFIEAVDAGATRRRDRRASCARSSAPTSPANAIRMMRDRRARSITSRSSSAISKRRSRSTRKRWASRKSTARSSPIRASKRSACAAGDAVIELLRPLDPASPIARYPRRRAEQAAPHRLPRRRPRGPNSRA